MVTLLCTPPSCAVQVGYDKERLAEESANPVLLVSESDRPGTAPAKHLKPEMVRTRPLPLFRDVNFTYHGPVEMGHYTDFDELGQMGSKVRAVRLGWLEPRIGRCRCAVCAARLRPLSSPLLLLCLTLLQSLPSATLNCFLHAFLAVTLLLHISVPLFRSQSILICFSSSHPYLFPYSSSGAA